MVSDGRTCLKLKTSRPGRVSECSNPPVVLKTATVEAHLLDTGSLGTLRNRLTDGLGRSTISPESHLLPQHLVRRACRRQGSPTHVINDLSVDVLV